MPDPYDPSGEKERDLRCADLLLLANGLILEPPSDQMHEGWLRGRVKWVEGYAAWLAVHEFTTDVS